MCPVDIDPDIIFLKGNAILPLISRKNRHHLNALTVLDEVDSTNDYLLRLAKKTTRNQACIAEKQTQGKGRQGKRWHSPFAQNIYLSLLWHFHTQTNTLSGLSLAVAISIVETLRLFGIKDNIGIKWPNDILVQNQKLSGILIETTGQAKLFRNTVIGIGLNVNTSPAQNPLTEQTIHQPWTCLQAITGQAINRNPLAAGLLDSLIQTLLLFEKKGFKAFMKKWNLLDRCAQKPVQVTTPTTQCSGIGRGVDQNGSFLLETDDHTILQYASGEISVRIME